jgi:hypothetical protein
VCGDIAEATLDFDICGVEHPPALGCQGVSDAAPILDVVIACDEPPSDEAVDHSGDARPAHGQLLGEGRRGLVTLAEQDQEAVLGQAELDGRDRQLDLAGEASDDSARVVRWFGNHIIRIPK